MILLLEVEGATTEELLNCTGNKIKKTWQRMIWNIPPELLKSYLILCHIFAGKEVGA
jgi:hypothetical protein